MIFSFELLIILGLPCILQSTPCEHWTTVKNIVFCNSQWKKSKLVSVKINNDGTLTLVESDILINIRFLTSHKVCFDWKQESLFNMIYFLIGKSILICTHACWLLKGVETGDSKIEQIELKKSTCYFHFKNCFCKIPTHWILIKVFLGAVLFYSMNESTYCVNPGWEVSNLGVP